MAFLMALVEDPAQKIAGRYFCKDVDKDDLRNRIRADWEMLNNYTPVSLEIEFQPQEIPDPAYEGEVITALEG